MSVTVSRRNQITVVETITSGIPDVQAANAKVTHDQYNTNDSLTSSSTPPVTTTASFSQAMTAGAATIDLRALTGTNGGSIDLNGLKVQIAMFHNPITNANAITVTFGASNGYLLGGTAWKVILSPGDRVTYDKYDTAPDVDATHKTIDISGTGSQALNCQIVAG